MNKIVFKNGKEFLKVSKPTWEKYLDNVSPYRNKNISLQYFNCAIKNKDHMWCYTCNTGIGNWLNSCNFVISSLNLQKYSHIFENDKDCKDKILIEVDRNDDKKTI